MSNRSSHSRPALASIAALIALGLGAATAPAQVVFEPPVSYPASVGVASNETMATGDIDGDGDVDAILGGIVGSGTAVLINQGDASFTQAGNVDHLGSSSDPGTIGLADLDDDGDLDLVIARTQVTVGLNDGTGAFIDAGSYSPAPFLGLATVGDVTGDGIPDIVAVSQVFFGAVEVLYLPGLGDGTFGPHVSLHVSGFALLGAPKLADLDDDGALDIVISRKFGATEVWVLLSGDDFALVTLPFTGGTNALDLADVDGDGHPDLLNTASDPDLLTLRRGLGGSAFGPAANWSVVETPRDFDVVDFDGDGHLDVAVSGLHADAVEVLRGDGRGGFSSSLIVSNAYQAWTVAARDLDGDGRGDLIVGSGDNNHPLQVLLNHTYEASSAYSDMGGQGLGGSGYPILLADGTPLPGRPVSFRLANAAPGTSAFLVLGHAALFAPLGSGTLGPSADLVLGPFATGAGQHLEVGGAWPEGVPGGTTFWLQYWLADPAAIDGYAPTSTVRVQVP